VRSETYGGGRDGSTVLLLAVEGGGHTWPGGIQYMRESTIGVTSYDIDAGEVIWDFFERATLPAP
jgi:polyhydroxybutyrate depolymerase